MPITPLPFANGFYESDSLPLSAQSCINLYPNIPQAPALSDAVLYGTPGITQLATTGTNKQANRGGWRLRGVPYYVNGNQLYKFVRTVDAEGVESFSTEFIGSVTGEDRVWMADNGTQLCVLVPGETSTGYIYDADSDTFVEITDADFKANGEPQAVVYIDGYFVFTTDSKKFIISAINDGLSYNALDFGTAEADPDDIVAPIVFRNQLFIGGTETMEAFQNIGGADFPFQRTGLFIQKGISSPFSIVSANDTFMFIGAGRNEAAAIWQLEGNTVKKVSTTAVDLLIQKATAEEAGQIFSWSYAESGAFFVGFSLPQTTIVLDTITGRWHERQSQYVDSKNVTRTIRSRVNSLVSAYGRIIVADFLDGRIGELSNTVYKEYDQPLIAQFSTMPFQNNMQHLKVPMIELTTESGVGNTDAVDPKVTMDLSKDGGKTFKDERRRKLGKVGEYNRRAIWRRNGDFPRFVVMRFKISDPVKRAILQLTADIVG